MEAKEPCIDCPNINLDDYGYLCDLACGKRTAWLNYVAGIREVGIRYEKYLRDFGASDDMIKANTWLQALLRGELPN